MSFLKSIIKSVFKRKENIKAKSYTYNDSLENFITEKEIRCYEYSDFKEVKEVRQAFVRAKFEDEFFTLKSFVNDDETIRKVIIEIELLHNISHKNILKFYGVSRIED
ncbi:unnamed protein product [Rhizophagus irregularis]|nr:unnamed protein product [Rhizophagus irregularis]